MQRTSKGDPLPPRARNVDRFMQRFMHSTIFRLSPRDPWQPAVDVYELEGEIQVVVDLAGVDRERVEVILEGDRLLIRGWRSDPAPRKRVRLLQIEIDHGLFERVLRIEAVVDRDKLEAIYRDGFLRVRLPKARDQERREVEIRQDEDDQE